MGRALLVAAALGMGCAAGCAPTAQRDPRAYFDRGYAAFEQGRWQAASDDFTRYLRLDPSSAHRGEVYYYRGLAGVRLGRRAGAKEDFKRALAAAPEPRIAAYARAALGNLYYEEGDDANAVAAYAPLVRQASGDVPLEKVILRTAVSLQRLGKWAMADAYLAYVMQNYSRTPEATEARRRYRVSSFCVQTGAYASVALARSEAERLRRAGYAPRVGRVVSGGRPLHTVQVGSAKTYAEASALAARLHGAGFSVLIVP